MKRFPLLSIGTSGIKDEEVVNRIILVNRIALFVSVAIAGFGPVICYFLKWKTSVVVPLSIEFLLNCTVLFFNYNRKNVTAALILYSIQCGAIIYFSIVLGRLLQLEFTIVLLIAIAHLIFKAKRFRRIALAMAFIDLAVLEVVYYHDPAQSALPISYNGAFLIHVGVVIGLMILTILVSRPYIKSNDIRNELQRANYLIKIFVAQVTHELRTPLDSIHQVMQLLRKEVQDDEKEKKIQFLVDIGYTVSSNARNIVNNVLCMAEIEAGKTRETVSEAFKVIPFFETILEVHKIIARRENIRLQLKVEAEMPQVIFGDPLNINQVLTNLLANAIKYGEKENTVNVVLNRRGANWELSVSNFGQGIPPEKRESIFDPFVTGSTGYIQGSGLGLYIVKNKVGSMGGTITVESRPEGQTTFTVSLPLREGKLRDLADAAAGPDPDCVDLNKVQVLVAEDNKLTSYLISRFLKDMGCSYTIVKNGQELLEEAQTKCPDDCPDIIILDCHMPVLNGEETILALKKTPGLSHIPIIFTTGDLYSDMIEKMLAAGADTYLKKPIDHVALRKTIGLYLKKLPLN